MRNEVVSGRRWFVAVVIAIPLAASGMQGDAAPSSTVVQHRLGGLSVPFIENAGQYDAQVRFAAPTFAGTLFVTGNGELVYALPGMPHDDANTGPTAVRGPGLALSETFVGGHAAPRAGIAHATNVSRFVGNDPAQQRAHLRTFEDVSLGEVFPGIDVRLRATGRNVEKIFTVAPHGDPGRIRIAVGGSERIAADAAGRLIVTTTDGDVAFTAPVAYQTIAGRQVDVPVQYALDTATRRYGFSVGRYDAALPLVIDPLLQATYLGGASHDQIFAIAVHPVSGEVLVAGSTQSLNFPCVTSGGGCSNGAQPVIGGNGDGFVARLNPGLTTLLQATYFGGTASDGITALAVHPVSGEILVAGYTASANLPCTTAGGVCADGAQKTPSGNFDGFVARLNPTLTSVLQATYLGGVNYDYIAGLAVHPVSGEILVAGYTSSTDFPCTTAAGICQNGAQSVHGADGATDDGFVARFNASLTSLLQATYFGGNALDRIAAVAVHPVSGEILVAGLTTSPDLPCTSYGGICANGAQDAEAPDGALGDGFVARFNPALTSLLQATYLGGTGYDEIRALAVHPASGEVLVAGLTQSTNFPCTTAVGGCANGAQSVHGANPTSFDGFVARLNPQLTRLLQATFLGGSGSDSIYAMAVHPGTGEVFVGGLTDSSDLPCTTSGGGCGNGAQAAHASDTGGLDGFVARLDASLTHLWQSTYFGGDQQDQINALTVNPATGEVLGGGLTVSDNLPCTVAGNGCANGAQTAMSPSLNPLDAFVVRISPDLTLLDGTPNAFAFAAQNNAPRASLRTSAPAQITGIVGVVPVYVEGQLGSAYCISSGNDCSCDASGGFLSSAGSMTNNQYACVRHVSAPVANRITETLLHVGGSAAAFRVATGTMLAGCALDVDGNNTIDALTDGLMLLRAMFGLTGTAVTANAVGSGATRSTWAQIQPFLNGNCGTTFAP